jgi:UDP:flavonoid glycosyltransferase YjiC (YdhE family)
VRVLFTCTRGIGHFHPLVPIARAMADAGHEVAFATMAALIPTVEGCGFRAFRAGMAQSATEAFPELRAARGHEFTALWLGRVRPAQADATAQDITRISSTWRPDLVVHETAELGGCIAAERLGVPYAVVEVLATGIGDKVRSMLSAGLAEVLAHHGLRPDPKLTILERQLVLSPFPPSFRGVPQRVADTPWHVVRPTPFDQSGDTRPPPWMDELAARPTVYVTLGTAPPTNSRQGILRAFVDGLADEPINLVVTVGPNNDPSDLGPVPSNARIERYIAQTVLFPHCQLVVSHGGSGTVMAALAYGLPMVVVPITADQPQNARRCVDLRVARALDETPLDPMSARSAVLEVLGDPTYRENAEKLRAEIDALPGPEHAVTLLERLAAGKNPTMSNQ